MILINFSAIIIVDTNLVNNILNMEVILMIYENILDLIGNTPVVKLKFLNEESIADIYVKLEKYNIVGSV